MFEKEAEEYATKECCTTCAAINCKEKCECWTFAKKGAEFGYNKAKEELTLPKDILGLWEQTVCEIRSEIKSWDLKGPHVSDYTKELCDKLEHSMCAVAGGPYSMRYRITD